MCRLFCNLRLCNFYLHINPWVTGSTWGGACRVCHVCSPSSAILPLSSGSLEGALLRAPLLLRQKQREDDGGNRFSAAHVEPSRPLLPRYSLKPSAPPDEISRPPRVPQALQVSKLVSRSSAGFPRPRSWFPNLVNYSRVFWSECRNICSVEQRH